MLTDPEVVQSYQSLYFRIRHSIIYKMVYCTNRCDYFLNPDKLIPAEKNPDFDQLWPFLGCESSALRVFIFIFIYICSVA